MSANHETLHELEAQHTAIEDEISSNLKQGLPTLEARRKLTDVKAKLTVVRNTASASVSREQAESLDRANATGRTAAAAAVAGIEASISHLAAVPVPGLSTAHLHPVHASAIEQAASALALAEDRHAEAVRLHANAEREVSEVNSKLTDAQNRHAAIVAERRDGKKSPGQEAELYALSVDIADLQGVLGQVRATAAELNTNGAARAVADARKALDRVHGEARATLLADHVKLLTRTLEAALYETESAGRAVGKSLHVLWQPSPVLRQALHMGALPALPRHHGA